MKVTPFYDPATFTLTYLVHDEATRDAVIIDPVLDYDPLASKTATTSVEKLAAVVRAEGLRVHLVLETHAHADHLSAAQWLRRRFDARVVIGAGITRVQEVFKQVFDLPASFRTDGGQFDLLVRDGDVVPAGSLSIRVLATPGHTPACVSYLIGDAVFTGDALFLEDQGTGRTDFPLGSAATLWDSVHERLYRLPDATRVFVGHDYQPDGREVRWESTIGAGKRGNVHLSERTSRDDYVRFREGRDRTLSAPRLLYPSVQVNIDAGRLPAAHPNGTRYLRVPLDLGRTTDDDGSAK